MTRIALDKQSRITTTGKGIKKMKSDILKILRYFCLLFVIAFSLMAIIDCGSGDDSTTTTTTTTNTDPTANITSPSGGSSYTEGETITFSGTGSDTEDGTLTGSSLVWTSSIDAQIGTGTSFRRNDMTAGTHTITLNATDSNGATGSDSVSIIVSIDNSKFYGNFALSATADSCDVIYFKLTIGGDSSRRDEEGYYYIPEDANSTSYSGTDDDGDTYTMTITVSGDTVTIDEEEQWQGDPSKGWTMHLELAYSNSYNNITISGSVTDDDPDECQGTITGSAVKEGTVGVSIDSQYLQYRTYSDANDNKYRGWMSLTKDGIPVEVSDITKVELKNSTGAVVNETVDVNDLWIGASFGGGWNSSTSSVSFSGPFLDCGFSIRFPGGVELPAGNYTYEVTTSEGDIVSETFNYPGKKELPVVQSANMSSEWLGNDLHLEWVNPAGDYDQLRVVLRDEDWNEWYIRLPTDVVELTIPAVWVQNFVDLFESTTLYWRVQTRSYTNDNVNYARGYSDDLQIPDMPYPTWKCQDDDADNGIYRICNYFPLNPGNSWEYKIGLSTGDRFIANDTMTCSSGYSGILYATNTYEFDSYLQNGEDGLLGPGCFYNEGDFEDIGVAGILIESEMQIGETVSSSYPDWSISSTFAGIENITVPAGSFITLKFEILIEDSDGSCSYKTTIWFGKNIGIIKIHRTEANPSDCLGCFLVCDPDNDISKLNTASELTSALIDGVGY